MPAPTLIICDSVDADLPAIKAIYAHHVLHGTASFELDPPSIEEMRQRRAAVLAQGMFSRWPRSTARWWAGAYATPYRPRPAYRHTVEDSVYVKTGRGGLGIGGKLLAALVERCAAAGWRQMLAVVGDSRTRPRWRCTPARASIPWARCGRSATSMANGATRC